MKNAALLIAIVASAAITTSHAQTPPTALSEVVRATHAARAAYAFDFEYSSNDQSFVARFDPRQTPRLRLASPARASLSDELSADLDFFIESMDGVTWCASEQIGNAEGLRLLRQDDNAATYSFEPTRESVTGDQTRRIVEHLSGEITITKSNPDISRIRLFALRPFSPAPLARIEHYSVTTTCAAAPNGRHYAVEIIREARGSAFGRAFNTRTVRRVRNVTSAS
jgi:hypothetical protein